MSNEIVEDVKVKGDINILVGLADGKEFLMPRYYSLYSPYSSKRRNRVIPLFKPKYQQRFQQQEQAWIKVNKRYKLLKEPIDIFNRVLTFLIEIPIFPDKYLPRESEVTERGRSIVVNKRTNDMASNRYLNKMGEIRINQYSFAQNFPAILRGFLEWEKFKANLHRKIFRILRVDIEKLKFLVEFLSELDTQEGISFEQAVENLMIKTLQNTNIAKK